jgi:hypothetical protein
MAEKIETSHKMTIILESFRNEDLARAIETFHDLRDEKAVLLQNKLKVTLTIEGFAAAPLEELLSGLQEHVHGNELKVDGKVDRKYPFSDLSLGKVISFVRQRITPGTPMDAFWNRPQSEEPAEEMHVEEAAEEEVTV